MKWSLFSNAFVFVGFTCLFATSCKHTSPIESEAKEGSGSPASKFFCKTESSSWGALGEVTCKDPLKLCYSGSRRDAIAANQTGGVFVKEDHALRQTVAGAGNSITGKIWDVPNNIEAGSISFGACRKSVLPKPTPDTQPNVMPPAQKALLCFSEEGGFHRPDEVICADPWKFCFRTTAQDALATINDSPGVMVSDDHELRSASIISGGKKVKVEVWDIPNDMLADSSTFGKCIEP